MDKRHKCARLYSAHCDCVVHALHGLGLVLVLTNGLNENSAHFRKHDHGQCVIYVYCTAVFSLFLFLVRLQLQLGIVEFDVLFRDSKLLQFLFCLSLFRSVPFSLPLQLLFVHRIRLIVNFVSFSSRFNSIIFNGYVFDFKTNKIRYHVYTRRHFCLFRWQLKKWMRWERIQNERTSHSHNVHSLYSTQIYRTTNGFR